jgi:hypothetical protein
MNTTVFFQCEHCHAECRVDAEGPRPSDSSATSLLTIRHCPDSEGVVVLGKVTSFQERRGGVWVPVQRWIDAA